jgi:hypothetical protein
VANGNGFGNVSMWDRTTKTFRVGGLGFVSKTTLGSRILFFVLLSVCKLQLGYLSTLIKVVTIYLLDFFFILVSHYFGGTVPHQHVPRDTQHVS